MIEAQSIEAKPVEAKPGGIKAITDSVRH